MKFSGVAGRIIMTKSVAKFAAGVAICLPLVAYFFDLATTLAVSVLAAGASVSLFYVRSDFTRLSNEIENLGKWIRRWEANANAEQLPVVSSNQAISLRGDVESLTERIRNAFEEMQDLAQKDPLTGLPNRAYFEKMVEQQLKQNAAGPSGCLIFMDIDGFKTVNDTLGHHIGDQLIRIAAERLRLTLRFDDEAQSAPSGNTPSSLSGNVARLGGDEFTIFIPGVTSESVALKVASRILRVFGEPFELGSQTVSVSVSIGIALCPRDGSGYFDLLRAADTAMYHAKKCGRNRAEVYSTSLDEELRKLSEAERDLRGALAQGQFELLFQPLFDCQTLRITSAEALIRWQHPERGLIMPSVFIPLAERLNLINEIGDWVVQEVVSKIAAFEREGIPLMLSVNISPNQLQKPEFVSFVKACLSHSQAQPRLLELEITESVAMQNVDLVADRLARFNEMGVSIAIDDFGIGYSNLASLIRLPFSRLKIDQSLLNNLVQKAEARTLVQTIVSMANGLGFHSVAEGVETSQQLELLRVMSCDVVQGFLLSKPITEDRLRELLLEQRHSISSNEAGIKAA